MDFLESYNSQMNIERSKAENHGLNLTSVGYWQSKLHSAVPLDFPTDYSRGPHDNGAIGCVSISIGIEEVRKLTALISPLGIDLHVVFLTVFSVLLQRYCEQDDICIGVLDVTNSNSQREDELGRARLKISRNVIMSNLAFNNVLIDVWKSSREFEKHALSFDEALEIIEGADCLSLSELCRFIFSFSNQHDSNFDLLTTNLEKIKNIFSFDIFLSLGGLKDGSVAGRINFNGGLFEEATALRIRDHYINLLKSIVSEPETLVGRLQILSIDEYSRVIFQWNRNSASYPFQSCVHNLFEAQVIKSPSATAIIFGDEKISYQDLNAKANKLARFLIMHNVNKEDLIGICLDRSIEMIICLLAVLKSGAAYVPLDPEYPDVRIEQMIRESQMSVILTDVITFYRIKIVAEHVVRIDDTDTAGQISIQSEENLDPEFRRVMSSDLAYVIFTSGSTGTPKGVMVEHRGLINLYEWYASCIYSNSEEKNLLISSLSFDLTQKNIFSTLLHGHILVIPKMRYFDKEKIIECAKKNDITLINCAPSAWKVLYHSGGQLNLPKLRSLVLGGEALDSIDFNDLFSNNPGLRVFNSYGPTECSDVSAYFKIDAAPKKTTKIPIGKGIPNTLHYILDGQLQPVPIGVVGELYIGGVGVARGYFNQSMLTFENFFQNPFEKGERNRIYRTSDLCRYLPSGEIEFCGRKDQQIKIRGNRVELGEVEKTLLNHPEIKDVVVLCKNSIPQGKHLVAFLVLNNDFEVNLFREYLKNLLPYFMIPSYFFVVDKIPVTENGKIDKNSLLNLDVTSSENVAEEMTLMQKEISKVFAKHLGFDKFSLDDDLFAIGGDSIMVVRIFSEINRDFGVNIGVDKIFSSKNITIRWVVNLVEKCQIEAIGVSTYELLLKKVEAMTDEQVQALLLDNESTDNLFEYFHADKKFHE